MSTSAHCRQYPALAQREDLVRRLVLEQYQRLVETHRHRAVDGRGETHLQVSSWVHIPDDGLAWSNCPCQGARKVVTNPKSWHNPCTKMAAQVLQFFQMVSVRVRRWRSTCPVCSQEREACCRRKLL